MSWQDYVDNQLIASQCVSKACIAGHDGGIWAKSEGFDVSIDEKKNLEKIPNLSTLLMQLDLIFLLHINETCHKNNSFPTQQRPPLRKAFFIALYTTFLVIFCRLGVSEFSLITPSATIFLISTSSRTFYCTKIRASMVS